MSRDRSRARRRQLGHRARGASGARRTTVRLWARDRRAGRARWRARAETRATLPDVPLPAGRHCRLASLDAALDGAPFVIVAVPSHGAARRCPRGRAAPPDRRRPRQRDEGSRSRFARRMSEVIAEETAAAAAGRRALRTELRGRGRARPADGGARRLRECRRGDARPGQLPRPRRCASTPATTWRASRLAAR